jgi:hypothetical protein
LIKWFEMSFSVHFFTFITKYWFFSFYKISKFRTPDELKALRGFKSSNTYNGGRPFQLDVENLKDHLPDQYDWRLFGAVTPVKVNFKHVWIFKFFIFYFSSNDLRNLIRTPYQNNFLCIHKPQKHFLASDDSVNLCWYE